MAIHNLSDADFIFTGPVVTEAETLLRVCQLPPDSPAGRQDIKKALLGSADGFSAEGGARLALPARCVAAVARRGA